VVERMLPKHDIVGSSPITRSNVEERLPRRFCWVICKVAVMLSPKGKK